MPAPSSLAEAECRRITQATPVEVGAHDEFSHVAARGQRREGVHEPGRVGPVGPVQGDGDRAVQHVSVHPLVAIRLGALGGLRYGEATALRRRRVDLLGGRVEIAETLVDVDGEVTVGAPKTKAGRRVVPLPRTVVHALDEHMAAHVAGDADALLFTSPSGKPLRRGYFRTHVWLPAVRAAGLEPLTYHQLRHSYVSLMVDAGLDPKQVSVRAGHSSVAFSLDRYGHLYEDRADDLPDQLDAALERARRTNPGVALRPVRGLERSAGGDAS